MAIRQRVWVDRGVQGVLIGRVVLYWALGLLYMSLGALCFQYYQHPNWPMVKQISVLFSQAWPWIPSAFLFMPLVVFDIIRLSNLFAGPIYRLRQHLSVVIQDSECRPLTFREDDYWRDLVQPINALQNQINDLKTQVAEYESRLKDFECLQQAEM